MKRSRVSHSTAMKLLTRGSIILVSSMLALFITLAGIVPMLMSIMDWQRIQNADFAIEYLQSQFGYTVLAEGEAYSGDFWPSENNSFDIGKEEYRWRDFWLEQFLHFGNKNITPDNLLGVANPQEGMVVYYNGTEWVALSPGTSGEFLQTQGASAPPTWAEAAGGGGGSSNFTGLTDTPGNYTDASGKLVRVNATPDALEFTNVGTITVAANDATLSEKSWAMATGGGICDTIDDWDDVQAAIAVSDNVRLTTGTYYFDQGETCVIEDCTLEGAGSYFLGDARGTIISLNGNSDGLWLKEGGKLWHLRVNAPTSFNGIACLIQADAGDAFDRETQVLLDVSFVGDGANRTGTAIKLVADSTSGDNFIELCSLVDVQICAFNKGVHLYCHMPANSAWVNGNDFVRFIISKTIYPIYYEGDGNGGLNANRWVELLINSIQSGMGAPFTDDVISFHVSDTAEINYNQFFLSVWDTSANTGSVFNFGSAGLVKQNWFIGQLGTDNVAETWEGSDAQFNNIAGTTTPTWNIYRTPEVDAFSGEYIWGQASENLTAGQVCYLTGRKWAKANANAAASSDGALSIAMNTISADGWGMFCLKGTVNFASYSFTANAVLYLSTTAGTMNTTPPSGEGDIVRVVGQEHQGGTKILFNGLNMDIFELDASGNVSKINGIPIA